MMAGSVNRVILIGRAGKDPETKNFQNGGKIVNFSLATSRTWKDRGSGERREDTTWHNIAVTNTRLGEIAEKHLRKGAQVYVEGEIRQRSWEKDGEKRYITEIVVGPFDSRLDILSGRTEEREDAPRQATRTDARGNPQYSGGDLDDEIPF